MANMHDCLQRAISQGTLDATRGGEAIKAYDQLVDRYRTDMGEDQAHARAAAHLRRATPENAAGRRHKVLAQLQAMRRIDNLIRTSPDPAAAIRKLLEFSEGSGFKGESVRSIQESYKASGDKIVHQCAFLSKVRAKLPENATASGWWVICPFLVGCSRRIHAAILSLRAPFGSSFWADVMPLMPMFGRSLSYVHSHCVA